MRSLLAGSMIRAALAILASIYLPPTPHDDRDAVALAQVFVAEQAGEWGTTPDEAAILAVLRDVSARSSAKTGKPCSIRCAARQYAPGTVGARAPRTEREAWLQALSRGIAPRGFEGAWKASLGRAKRYLEDGAPLPCAELPHHWGGPMDRERARKMGFRRIDCGRTANDFYRIP